MKFSSKVVSLLLVAGLAVTTSEANHGVGQGSMHGSGRSNFDRNAQGLYADPTRDSFGEDAKPIQNSISEEQNTLPPGWSEHFDQSSGQYYYYNSLDGTTTWTRPLPAYEDPLLDSFSQEGIEIAETQASDFTVVSERNTDSLQEDQKNKDTPLSHQQSWDSHDPVMSKEHLNEANSVKSPRTNRESQRADNFSPIGQSTDDADGQEWAQRHITSEQVENRDSLQLSNGPIDNTAGVLSEQGVPRDPGIIVNTPNRVNDPAESQENDSRQGNTATISDRVNGENAPGQPQIGGWGLPTQGTEELSRGTAFQPSSPAFVQREKYADSIPQYSDSGRASGPSKSRQIENSRTPSRVRIHEQSNSVHQNHIQPNRPSQASSVKREQRQQFVGDNSASNGQSATQHRQPAFGNGDPRFNAPRHPPNPAYDSRSGGPRPSLPQPKPQNSQYSQHAMPPQAQFQHPQYQQSQGNPRPSPQYTNYNTQQQRNNQQPSISGAVTNVLEDGTEGVKEVLGKSWQGLLGFSSRTREAMGQARDQVVTGAS
ncbi:MAG: hypothetical protein SGBAC_011352, partial [Bacillariaceae sp.]